MGQIITIASGKGGAGKSTVAKLLNGILLGGEGVEINPQIPIDLL